MRFWNKKEKIAGCFAVCDFLRAKGAEIEGYAGNSSDQDFALAAKSARMCRFSQESSPLLKANFKWAGFGNSEGED